MIATMTKAQPKQPNKRDRKAKFDAKTLGKIAETFEGYIGRIKAVKAALEKDRIPYVEFDGASGIDRAEQELVTWIKLATLDVMDRRGDFPELN